MAIKKTILEGVSLDSLLVGSVVIAVELEDRSVVWSCSCELNARKLSIPAAVRLEGRTGKRRSDDSHQPARAIDGSALQLCDGRSFVYEIVPRRKVEGPGGGVNGLLQPDVIPFVANLIVPDPVSVMRVEIRFRARMPCGVTDGSEHLRRGDGSATGVSGLCVGCAQDQRAEVG